MEAWPVTQDQSDYVNYRSFKVQFEWKNEERMKAGYY